jgi:hypothetical protein
MTLLGSGLDTSVASVNGFMLGDLGVLESVAFCSATSILNVLAQCALVAFKGEDVISLLVEDFPIDLSWQPMASMATTAPSTASIS